MTSKIMKRGALLSECGTYRYRLTRLWNPSLPTLGWIMLNPSTADASVDDPTIRKCVGFAERGGFGSIVVANLFAFRATDPKRLKHRAPWALNYGSPLPVPRLKRGARVYLTDEIVGPHNDAHILEVVALSRLTVLAWGAHGSFGQRDEFVMHKLGRAGLLNRTIVLDRTKEGAPSHPLYLPYETIDAAMASQPLGSTPPPARNG